MDEPVHLRQVRTVAWCISRDADHCVLSPQAFNDITTGSNPGCSTNGFSAAKGWDPVTGMGSPNFPALKKALKL
jgi:hypothetical protein